MQRLTARDVIQIWELGQDRSGPERALVILRTAFPDRPPDAWAGLPPPVCERALLAVREQLFGPSLACGSRCPACDEQVEFTLAARELAAGLNPEPVGAAAGPSELQVGEGRLQVRLPVWGDLAAAAAAGDLAAARRLLAVRLASRPDTPEGAPEEAPPLGEEELAAVARWLDEVAAGTDLTLALSCPACGHGWQAVFEIASFLWTEISAEAYRLFHQVHVLAGAYGWSEGEILSLSALRRQAYLEMVDKWGTFSPD